MKRKQWGIRELRGFGRVSRVTWRSVAGTVIDTTFLTVIVVLPIPLGVRGQVRALVTGTRPGRGKRRRVTALQKTPQDNNQAVAPLGDCLAGLDFECFLTLT